VSGRTFDRGPRLRTKRGPFNVRTEGDLAKVARRYGRLQTKVRTLKARLKLAERELKDARREMRTLISVRRK
jgi:hypothetical protein